MNEIKKLLTAFERYAHGQSQHSAFTQLLDWTLLPFKKFNTKPEQQQAFETFQNHAKVDQLTTLLTLIGELSEGFCDPLGELFMQCIRNGHNGQYFTPEPIFDMMATMSLGDKSTENQTVCDCACGSGRMLLNAAKINRHLLLYGADLDKTCCKLALANMLLNSLQGEIAHMNSLSNEFYTGYKICTTLVGSQHVPYYIEFTEEEKSRIWLKPVESKPKSTPSVDNINRQVSMDRLQMNLCNLNEY